MDPEDKLELKPKYKENRLDHLIKEGVTKTERYM